MTQLYELSEESKFDRIQALKNLLISMMLLYTFILAITSIFLRLDFLLYLLYKFSTTTISSTPNLDL